MNYAHIKKIFGINDATYYKTPDRSYFLTFYFQNAQIFMHNRNKSASKIQTLFDICK